MTRFHDEPRLFCLLLALLMALGACRSSQRAASDRSSDGCADPFPLSPQMALLERDLNSPDYVKILEALTNRWDVVAEFERVDVPDNAADFARRHGGVEAIKNDPVRRAAYARRVALERRFLALLHEKLGERTPKPGDEPAGAPADETGTAKARELDIRPVVSAPGADQQWPRWRGPTAQGVSAETGLPVEWDGERNIAWKTEIPGSGNSSPIIWDDRIFLTTAFDEGKRRSLVGLRRSDGKLLFVADAPAVPPETHVKKKAGYASATPATDGERVVAFLGNTGLVCFDLDGKLLWHHAVPPFAGSHGTAASPLLWRDLAILMQEHNANASIGVAVDKRTGERRWSFERPATLGWCSPIAVRIEGADRILYGAKRTVLAYDPATGREVWHCSGPSREVIPTLVCGHGMVYSTSGRSGPTVAIRPVGTGDITETSTVWRSTRGGPHVPSPVLWNDLLYLVNDTGILTCLDAKTGKTVYQKRLKGRFTASLVAADGKIYATNETGDTFVIRCGREYELLRRNPLDEDVLASAAVLDGQIFIRGRKHLFAIGTRRAKRTARGTAGKVQVGASTE